LSFNSFSAADEPHPIIDSNYISKYSYDLETMNIEELEETKLTLKNYLKNNYHKDTYSDNTAKEELLVALLEYDDVRIQITDVIDEVINEYKVEEDVKNILLSFKSTFENIIKDNRHLVKNLRDYKAYDFRLGSAYLAMMSAFHETEESRKFYSRLVQDKKDDKTSIGRYNKKLKLSQENINLVKKEIEKHSEISDVKKVLAKIEKEILSRE
tara:strand:+ start:837 stop:1472 length:636 start_codon:yes stop_codon:yes gene_type:complete